MQLTFYAHSSFHIRGDDGADILIDPYETSGYLRYDPTFDTCDVVVVTHDHGDHSNVAAVPGSPEVVRGPGTHTAKGRSFTGIPSFHDREQGAKRGPINMMVSGPRNGVYRSRIHKKALLNEYRAHVNTITFDAVPAFRMRILEAGRRAEVDGKSFDLGSRRRIIRVNPDGTASVQ